MKNTNNLLQNQEDVKTSQEVKEVLSILDELQTFTINLQKKLFTEFNQ